LNVREYVLARDGHKCQHCKGKSGDKILNVHHLESRKTGGNAPSNLITLCETCHKAYHRGEIQLKQKRGTSLRDAAAMNVMRWAVHDKAKAKFENVHLTFGYITKHTRIESGVEKSHNADAFCIAKNVQAERLSSFLKVRLLPRHNRTLHVCNPKQGGIRRSAVASHWIDKSRLQRFDSVVWNGIKCFIFGSTNGRLVLRDIDSILVTPVASVNAKSVMYLNRNKGFVIQELICET